MNYSTAVFLINDNAKAVKVTYEVDAPNSPAKRTVFKTFDASLKDGDFVIVPTDTRHKLTVAKVVEVDVDINFDANTQIEWLVGKVDLKAFEEVLAQEAEAITQIKSAELRKKREELAEALIKDVGAVKKLPIALLGASGVAQITPPK